MSPPPFDLPDVLRTAGKPVTGTRARVYWLLRLTAERRHNHLMDTQPPSRGPFGWVPIHTLRAPWAGGAQGDRRVRDLQELFGVEYEVRRWNELGGPRESTATLYRLVKDPLSPLNLAAGSPGPSSACAGTAPVVPGLLAGTRFWTHEGGRPERAGTTLCIDPNPQQPLSPSAELAAGVAAGALGATEASECYRERLLDAYRAGLFASLRAHRHLVVWTSVPANSWSPLPTLVRALTALGAEHAGDWREAAA